MSGYLTPMLLIIGVSAANGWYNTGSLDLKIPVAGGIATGILAVLSNIPGVDAVTTRLAWLAFVGLMIAPVQTPTPLQNIEKITGF